MVDRKTWRSNSSWNLGLLSLFYASEKLDDRFDDVSFSNDRAKNLTFYLFIIMVMFSRTIPGRFFQVDSRSFLLVCREA